MIRIFTGWDEREAVGWHAFAQSVIDRTTGDYAIHPLVGGQQRDGTNAFTYNRFAVPSLCGWSGWALFVDGADMIAMADLAELWALRDPKFAVQVVKHDYKTRNPRKYLGTEMEASNEDYPRKNWSSVVLWNCAHMAHFRAREMLQTADGPFLHRFAWLKDDEIGELPREWNWLCDEYGANTAAKLLHWTCGIPAIQAHAKAPQAQAWFYYSAGAKREPIEAREKAAA